MRFFCGPDADDNCLFLVADDDMVIPCAARRDMTWVNLCAVLAGRALSM